MAEIDDIKKRIQHRAKPLNDDNFKKLYNSMIRLMVCMVVVLTGAIIQKNPAILQEVFNERYLHKVTDFITQSIVDFLPEDMPVSTNNTLIEHSDGTFATSSSQVSSLRKGRIIELDKDSLTIVQDNSVEVTYDLLTSVIVKKDQIVEKGDVIGTYKNSFSMTFKYLGKEISYSEYQKL